MSTQIYQMVTDRIVEIMQTKGVIPWRKSWRSPSGEMMMPKNFFTRQEYRGVNVWMLGLMPFSSPWWMTYKQAQSIGGQVRKGEKGTPVIFWSYTEKTKRDPETGEMIPDRTPFLRYYTAFNLDQIDGIEKPAPTVTEQVTAPTWTPHERAQAIVEGMPNRPTILHRADFNPAYSPVLDAVKLPNPEQFESFQEYYCTSFHELGHSTGHQSRLCRKGITEPKGFGSDPYAQEELVAELCAAYLCVVADIEQPPLENSAAYLAHWIKKLRDNPRWLVTSAAQAQKAADYIRGISHSENKPAQVGQEQPGGLEAAA